MFCAYTRPRYQMSFYRTIGPLVFFFSPPAHKVSLNSIYRYLLSVVLRPSTFSNDISSEAMRAILSILHI